MSAYAQWASTYPPHAHNALMRAEQRAVLDLLPDVRGRVALDLACGTGRYASILVERGAKQVIGIDLSAEMLARTKGERENFVQGKMAQLPFTNYVFDLVVCGLAIGHVQDLEGVISEVARALKSNGAFLYSDFHPLGYLAGWRRESSASNGRRFAVKHFAHLYSDHYAACEKAGLVIRAMREPIIGREIIEEFTGSDQVYRKWNGWPAALIIRADKV